MKIAFRIKSGSGLTRRYTPVFDALSHLVSEDFRRNIVFVREVPGPYVLQVTKDQWVTWEDVGELDGELGVV